ncbi:hypothetical protein Patl1_34406 [Pistacia atlantica]|uniref:Uncharacterized protein n=1 Tax=Pistacia atlantica TaxID=434234 RepID=A0ACC0ZPQ3_9ROSI|nr:hypothetical protein Patl1_34406 [Pistacia atlantica]
MSAPVTDAEKLIWSVLEAERPAISQLQDKSLIEANKFFLHKHEDSLMHRVAAAEMLYVLEPSKKSEAIKLIEDTTNNLVPTNGALGPVKEWKLKDCIAVHNLLKNVLADQDAALSKYRIDGKCVVLSISHIQPFLKATVLASPTIAHNETLVNPENGGAIHNGVNQSAECHCIKWKTRGIQGPDNWNIMLNAFRI